MDKQENNQEQIELNHEPIMVFTLEDVFNKTIEDVKGNVVYRIVNDLDTKSYIGITKNGLLGRFYGHRKAYEYNLNHPLYNSIHKYGVKNFSVQILHICENIDEMDRLEEEYIDYYNSFIGDFGFNKTRSGKDFNSMTTKQKSEFSKELWKNETYRKANLPNSLKNLEKLNNDPAWKEKNRNKLISINKNPIIIKRQLEGKIKKVLSKLSKLNLEINEQNYDLHKPNNAGSFRNAMEKHQNLFDHETIENYNKNKLTTKARRNIREIHRTLSILKEKNLEINYINYNLNKPKNCRCYESVIINYPHLFPVKEYDKYKHYSATDAMSISKSIFVINKLKDLNLEINEQNWQSNSIGIINYKNFIIRFPNILKDYGRN
jgi:hypothetical protein